MRHASAVRSVHFASGPLYDPGYVLEIDHAQSVFSTDLRAGSDAREPVMLEDAAAPPVPKLVLKAISDRKMFRVGVPKKWVVLGGQWLVVESDQGEVGTAASWSKDGVHHVVLGSDGQVISAMGHVAACTFAAAAGRHVTHCVPLGSFGGVSFKWVVRGSDDATAAAVTHVQQHYFEHRATRVTCVQCPLEVMLPHGALCGTSIGLRIEMLPTPTTTIHAFFHVTRAVLIESPSACPMRAPTWSGQPIRLSADGAVSDEEVTQVSTTLNLVGMVVAFWLPCGPCGPHGPVPVKVILRLWTTVSGSEVGGLEERDLAFSTHDPRSSAWVHSRAASHPGVLVSLAPVTETSSCSAVHLEWFERRRGLCFSRLPRAQLVAVFRDPVPSTTVIHGVALTCGACMGPGLRTHSVASCFDMGFQ
jgi:hypothetical protein